MTTVTSQGLQQIVLKMDIAIWRGWIDRKEYDKLNVSNIWWRIYAQTKQVVLVNFLEI